MVKDALALAGSYKKMEADALLSLCSGGAPVNGEAVADMKERLSRWRFLVVSFLIRAREEAETREEVAELSEALIIINRY